MCGLIVFHYVIKGSGLLKFSLKIMNPTSMRSLRRHPSIHTNTLPKVSFLHCISISNFYFCTNMSWFSYFIFTSWVICVTHLTYILSYSLLLFKWFIYKIIFCTTNERKSIWLPSQTYINSNIQRLHKALSLLFIQDGYKFTNLQF